MSYNPHLELLGPHADMPAFAFKRTVSMTRPDTLEKGGGGLGAIIGLAVSIAIPFAAPAIAESMGISSTIASVTGMSAGAAGYAGSALVGAGMAGVAGQNPLMGALGGAGGQFMSNGGFGQLGSGASGTTQAGLMPSAGDVTMPGVAGGAPVATDQYGSMLVNNAEAGGGMPYNLDGSVNTSAINNLGLSDQQSTLLSQDMGLNAPSGTPGTPGYTPGQPGLNTSTLSAQNTSSPGSTPSFMDKVGSTVSNIGKSVNLDNGARQLMTQLATSQMNPVGLSGMADLAKQQAAFDQQASQTRNDLATTAANYAMQQSQRPLDLYRNDAYSGALVNGNAASQEAYQRMLAQGMDPQTAQQELARNQVQVGLQAQTAGQRGYLQGSDINRGWAGTQSGEIGHIAGTSGAGLQGLQSVYNDGANAQQAWGRVVNAFAPQGQDSGVTNTQKNTYTNALGTDNTQIGTGGK